MNNSGVFTKAFSELTTYDIKDKNQIELFSFAYGVVEESDERVYPSIDMIIMLRDKDFQSYFCFTVNPYNAKMDNLTKDAGVYSGCDKELTSVWRKIMKAFFKDKWVEAFKQYCAETRVIRECEIMSRAEKEYQENERKYEEEINSI